LSFIDAKIKQRIDDRIEAGFDAEVKSLIVRYPDWSSPAFSATGYRLWRDYIQGKTSKKQAIDKWFISEKQYARRQLTWFKKSTGEKVDITKTGWEDHIVDTIESWYANN
jgi:tRNA dimethylallyltransferase